MFYFVLSLLVFVVFIGIHVAIVLAQRSTNHGKELTAKELTLNLLTMPSAPWLLLVFVAEAKFPVLHKKESTFLDKRVSTSRKVF